MQRLRDKSMGNIIKLRNFVIASPNPFQGKQCVMTHGTISPPCKGGVGGGFKYKFHFSFLITSMVFPKQPLALGYNQKNTYPKSQYYARLLREYPRKDGYWPLSLYIAFLEKGLGLTMTPPNCLKTP